ncbi:MarR family transcriptional regulator [Actinopolymorpha sp. B17G11]|uniref:MarR family winged helix-turn-helix transcriptional regulator n=1 Tax=Actinopolymorpha sp. B17G11 TaxID=3160861 RepID=UPI0032E4F0C9
MTTPRWLTASQQRIWRTYLLGAAHLMERLDQDLAGLGLSLPEYEILVRLSEAPDRTLRMAELAESVHHSRSRLTHTVSRMETAGLVERHSCPSDRRGVLAKLTDTGYDRLVEAAPIHVAGVRDGFVDLVSDADFEAIGRAFESVISRGGQSTSSHNTPTRGAESRGAESRGAESRGT